MSLSYDHPLIRPDLGGSTVFNNLSGNCVKLQASHLWIYLNP